MLYCCTYCVLSSQLARRQEPVRAKSSRSLGTQKSCRADVGEFGDHFDHQLMGQNWQTILSTQIQIQDIMAAILFHFTHQQTVDREKKVKPRQNNANILLFQSLWGLL